jgi:sugar O-acyltransferase (sialic acid O-acetyltransferase NeuD family)
MTPASPWGGGTPAAGDASPGALHLLGTGPLAEELWALALDAGIEVAAFVENLDRAKSGGSLCGRPILWVDDLPRGAACVCALSTTKRQRYVDQVAGRAVFPTLVHPSAVILPGTTLGEGTIVSAGVVIAGHAVIGRHVFCNRGVRVGHHTHLGDYVTLQPGANLAGLMEVGPAAYVGMGAIIVERLNIGTGATVAAGSVVIRDVAAHTMVAGNPAVVKKAGVDAR